MTLHSTIYSSADQVPPEYWTALTANERDLTMDRRLIGAFESKMTDCVCSAILIQDEQNRPMAIACNWLMRMDLANYPWLAAPVKMLRKIWPNCLKLGILFCGLPLPCGQNHIRFAKDAPRDEVWQELHRALGKIAAQQHAAMVVIQQFDKNEITGLSCLTDLGYLRAELPPMHYFDRPFGSFAEYVDALKSRYRSQVNRSLKKFQAGGFRVEQVRGPDELAARYTDELHKLYTNVWQRSPYKAEYYSADFMRELGRRFGADASLTIISRGDSPAGFTMGLRHGAIYHNLYSGMDYSLKADGDVYFNLFYNDTDFAWKSGATEIHLGQTSDDFKSRLGSRIEPMYLFIRPRHGLIRWGLRTFRKWALPAVKPVESHDVFKSAENPAKISEPKPASR
jgi:hypothetical protein